LARRLGVLVPMLHYFGLSSIANMLGAIKMAKHLSLGPDDVILSVATDGHELYVSELRRYLERRNMTEALAAELVGEHLVGVDTEHVLDATARERTRIFNLGYFTWVEQQGVALADFERRRSQTFWEDLHELIPQWDEMITAFNRDSGMAAAA
jgi:cysteine synthase A